MLRLPLVYSCSTYTRGAMSFVQLVKSFFQTKTRVFLSNRGVLFLTRIYMDIRLSVSVLLGRSVCVYIDVSMGLRNRSNICRYDTYIYIYVFTYLYVS